MAQTKIIVDTNSYFRLAQNIHPLLKTPFGDKDYTLFMHGDLNQEIKGSSRLQNKFHWVNELKYKENRDRTISLSQSKKDEIEETYEYMWAYVIEDVIPEKGKGPSPVDTKIVATAAALEILLVTDDQDMIELAELYVVEYTTSLGLMKMMKDHEHIDDEKIDQVISQWEYDNDTPYKHWEEEFTERFERAPPS